MHAALDQAGGRRPPALSLEDIRHARGLAYNGILEWIQFNQQRRINLAFNIGDNSVKGMGAWLTAFGLAKSVAINPQGALVLQAIIEYLPLFGMLMCIVLMGIARSVYQDEVNYIIEGLKYEQDVGGYGTANTRFSEIVGASFWRPATTELAGLAWFSLWVAISVISHYYM